MNSNNRYGTIDPRIVEEFESLSFDSDDNENNNANNSTNKKVKNYNNSNVFNKIWRKVSSLPAVANTIIFNYSSIFINKIRI